MGAHRTLPSIICFGRVQSETEAPDASLPVGQILEVRDDGTTGSFRGRPGAVRGADRGGLDLSVASGGRLDGPLLHALAAQEAVPVVPRVEADDAPVRDDGPPADSDIDPSGPGGVEAVIRSYDWDDEIALRVARCESGDDLHAEPWENWYHRGPLQVSYIHAWRYAARGWDWATATDEQHIAIAYEIQHEQGWAPWRASAYCWR